MKRVSFAWWLAIGGLLVAGWGLAQEPRPFPLPTREPPLAPPDPAPANDQRPDSTPRAQIPMPIQPAQFEQPIPQPLPQPTRIDDSFYPATPVVQIRVVAPSTIANGQEIVYRINVENRSQAQANMVRVRAPIFKDAPLLKSTPEPTSREKDLVWELGNLEAGAKREITVVLVPSATTTEVKMCARVSFEHGQCVTTKLAKPTLALKQTGSEEGVLFDPVTYRIEITNSGAVEVPNVRLTKILSDGLEFERVSVQPTTANGVLDVQTNNLSTERTWSFGR